MAEFKPGDTVQLKSGGPGMTIKFMDGDNECYCEWFDGTNLKGARFGTASLVPY